MNRTPSPSSLPISPPSARVRGLRLSQKGRIAAALWLVILLAGFSLALFLKPDARGFGTHTQLGFPGCSLREWYGVPCPFCGMTTSVSFFVRGEFVASAKSNAAGLWLAVLCTIQLPWLLASLIRGRLIGIARIELAAIFFLASVLSLSLLQWAVRLAF